MLSAPLVAGAGRAENVWHNRRPNPMTTLRIATAQLALVDGDRDANLDRIRNYK